MNGKHHMSCYTSIYVGLGSLYLLSHKIVGDHYTIGPITFKSFLNPHMYPQYFYDIVSNHFFHMQKFDMKTFLIVAIIGYFLGLFGTLLPDIDSERSILGRYVHLPIEHRTFTHTIWIVIILFLISLKVRYVNFIAVGYFIHLFMDSFSKAGICYLYPLSRYRVYPGGAKIKKGHFGIYSTSDNTEVIFCVFVYIVCLVILGFSIYSLYFK